MKRYDLELTATGPAMEEREHGEFVQFSEVERFHATNKQFEQELAKQLADAAIQCGVMAELLREVTKIVPAIGVAIDDLPVVDAFLERVEMVLAGKLPNAWLPIETAPSDGRKALVYRPLAENSGDERIAVKRLTGGRSNHCWDKTVPPGETPCNPTDGACHVTHWMPLPYAPTQQECESRYAAIPSLNLLIQMTDILKMCRSVLITAHEDVQDDTGKRVIQYRIKLATKGINMAEHAIDAAAQANSGRFITEGQELELVTVLQSIVNGFSDDPAHDAAALLKRITGEVPWTGDSFQLPPHQGGEPLNQNPIATAGQAAPTVNKQPSLTGQVLAGMGAATLLAGLDKESASDVVRLMLEAAEAKGGGSCAIEPRSSSPD